MMFMPWFSLPLLLEIWPNSTECLVYLYLRGFSGQKKSAMDHRAVRNPYLFNLMKALATWLPWMSFEAGWISWGFSEKSDKYLAEWSPFLTDFISTTLSDGGTFQHRPGILNTRAAELAASHTFVREHWDELVTIIKQLQSTPVSWEHIFLLTATCQNKNPSLEANGKTVWMPGFR